MQRLLDDLSLAATIGAAGQQRARDFLPDLHLAKWAWLLTGLARSD